MEQEIAAKLAGPIARQGLFLESVKVGQAGRRKIVRVVVDLPEGPGGVSSDALTDVSREISAVLDDADLIRGAYTLEVTTPGTDRPLTEPRHFSRAVGRLVTVTTADGEFTDRLVSATDTHATFESHDVALGEVERAKVQVELKREN